MSVYEGHGVTLHHGDCLDVLRSLPDCSVDSVVCDPPYALGFMGREWDTFGMDVGRGAQARSQRRAEVTPTGEGHSTSAGPYLASGVDSLRAAGLPFQRWCEAWATECLRVLKPGAHLLAFGGTRTWHRLACAVEDAGFEVRDSIAWMYGSGFPKSLDVSKAIDKAAGAEREASGVRGNTQCGYLDRGEQCPGHDDAGQSMSGATVHRLPTAPATDAAREWEGWGTALKPSFEGIVCATKPVPALARIGSRLDELEQSCRPPASGAVPSSAPTHPDSLGARTASAPASAATRREDEPARTTPTGAAAGSSAATATSASELTGATFWNTVTSWKACWAELCEATSTSTTGTTSSTTTDLETLWCCLSQITPESTTTDPTSPDGLSSFVGAVDAMFAAAVLNSRATRTLTAIGSATSGTPPTSPAAGGSRAAFEPVVVARKPLTGTVAANVLSWGTGALNVDGCRIETTEPGGRPHISADGGGNSVGVYGDGLHGSRNLGKFDQGRWPANVVLDEDMAGVLDEMSGESSSVANVRKRAGTSAGNGETLNRYAINEDNAGGFNDTGGASRFFYVAKADASERPRVNGTAHPTVKPLDLMRWLVRLVTPPGGTVLEPFAGSGTTVEACIIEGFQCIAIEREADYLPLIRQRIDRRRDPVEALRGQAADLGLFDLLGGEGA